MPQLGETVTEGTITKWYKAVGDTVARDEPLFEVSTDKVDSEVPSPAEGVLTAILVEEGDTVDVGVTLAVIGDEVPANGNRSVAAPDPTATAAPPAPDRPAADAADRLPADDHTGDPSPAPTPEPAPVGGAGPAGGLVLSPVVRRLIDENGIDPSRLTGTGLGGRITRADVEASIAGGGSAADPPPRRQRPRRPRHATRSSRSPTSADGRPSTWCVPRPPRRTP
jgi:2-oxoglutarate dehydrogenase E2 component (dihydrolipoamide succinyltransferase)